MNFCRMKELSGQGGEISSRGHDLTRVDTTHLFNKSTRLMMLFKRNACADKIKLPMIKQRTHAIYNSFYERVQRLRTSARSV